jgi:hypothetical protein
VAVAHKAGPVTDAHKIMIFVLISIAWLTIVAIILNACRSAARGDEMLTRKTSDAAAPRPRSRVATSAGALWQDGPGLTGAHQLRLTHLGGGSRHSSRARGGCATGS